MQRTNMPVAPAIIDILRPKSSTTYRRPGVQREFSAPHVIYGSNECEPAQIVLRTSIGSDQSPCEIDESVLL